MKKIITTLVLFVIIIFYHATNSLSVIEGDDESLRYLLELSQNIPKENFPKEQIYRDNEILFCTGESKAALANNHAATLMKNGKFEEAALFFEKAIKHAPIFYPFRYNIGKCYYHLNKMRLSIFHLNKARLIVPEYFLTYLQIGYLFEYKLKYSKALDNYRKAARLYPGYLKSYILAGNIYLKRNQLELAARFYDTTLKKDPTYANGILGRAKIMFIRKKYYKAYMLFKTIDTKQTYDKSLHYYFAECAYKLNDFNEAYNQYTKLLEFKNDRFFMTTSISLIKHKQFLSKRFSSEINEKKE